MAANEERLRRRNNFLKALDRGFQIVGLPLHLLSLLSSPKDSSQRRNLRAAGIANLLRCLRGGV
jgi:hypothetical protein